MPTQKSVYYYGKAERLVMALEEHGCKTTKILGLIIGEFADQYPTIEKAVQECIDKYRVWSQTHKE
jgi:hypothetical protein